MQDLQGMNFVFYQFYNRKLIFFRMKEKTEEDKTNLEYLDKLPEVSRN